MSIVYRIEPRGRLALIQTIDAIDPDQWDQVIERLLADPNFVPGCPILVDRRREDALEWSVSLRRMVDMMERHSAPLATSKWAMVVDGSNAEAFGVTRFTMPYPTIRHVEIEVFVGLEYAVRWLFGDSGNWLQLAEVCIWAAKAIPIDHLIETHLATGPLGDGFQPSRAGYTESFAVS